MWENWCGEGIPRRCQGQRQKMRTSPLTGNSLGLVNCLVGVQLDTFLIRKKLPPCRPLQPPHKERTVIPSGLISLNWQTKQWPNRSCGQGKSGTWLLTLTLSDWQRKNALMFWSSGVLESRLKIPVCWRFLFGHLTTLPHASVSLLFFSFDTLPFGVCFNIICSSRNLLHVFYAVPHMVRSWGNCSW